VLRPFLFAAIATAYPAFASAGCDDSILNGSYAFVQTGYTGSGTSLKRFALAGTGTYNGDGTLSGVSTAATEGNETPARLVTFTGTYSVKSDCSATETDTDQTGAVFHYDEFIVADGQLFTFIQTDPGVVSTGTQQRQQRRH
jgi:hypothetical protein